MMHLRLAISKSAGRTCISSRPVIAQFSQLAHDLQSDFVPRSKVEGRRESSSAFQIDDNGDSFMRDLVNNESFRDSLAYSLSFADEISGMEGLSIAKAPNERMREQLAISNHQLSHHHQQAVCPKMKFDSRQLPRSVQETLRHDHRNRAIVITEAVSPFRIFNVNKTWEGLCGYTNLECQGKPIGSLLGGPETDTSATATLMSRLMREEEAGTVLTNYKKCGKQFQNFLRVGTLTEDGEVTHFVGVLQEV